jgi:hypothetical protein
MSVANHRCHSYGQIDIDTQSMAYDPLDNEGFQRIRVGDRVRVAGVLENGLFDDLDLVADWVISLRSGSGPT